MTTNNDNWDRVYNREVSECCGASIIYSDICSACGEHTDVVEEEEE